MPGFSVGSSFDQLTPLVQASVAPTTWQAYGKAWRDWLEVAGGSCSGEVSSLLESVIRYLLHLREHGASSSVAQRRLSGLGFFFKLRGWVDVTKFFPIRQALKGWRKEFPVMEARRPVSYRLLTQLIRMADSVCSSQYEARLLAVAFGLSFFGALRVSELVPASRVASGGFLAEDIFCSGDHVRLRVRRSKVDQRGQGVWIPLSVVAGPACPVALVKNFLAIRS